MSRSLALLALLTLASAYKYALPFYRYPDAQWERIIGLSSVQLVIFNPDSGPGSRVDANYAQRVDELKAAGQLVGGYVYTSYGERPIADVKADIDAYFAFYPNIDGIFLDEAQSSASGSNAAGQNFLSYYAELKQYIRGKGHRKGMVLNHGTIPDEAYVRLADIDCIFEGPFSDYVNFPSRVPAWVHDYPPDKFWHIVHSTPYEHNRDVVEILRATNAHFLYVTDLTGANPYDSLPTWAVAPRPPPPPPPADSIKFGILQLFYPAGSPYSDFASAFNLDAAAPSDTDAALGFVAITPNAGPGTAVDSNYAAEVTKVQAHSGLALGFIALGNAAKPVAAVKEEIDKYYQFYGVDGFYFAETFSGTSAYFAELAAYAESSPHKPASAEGVSLLTYGPGSVEPAIADVVDIVQIFTGTYSEFQAFTPPSWALSRPASKFYYTVTNVPEAELDAFIATAVDKNAGYVYASSNSDLMVPPYLPLEIEKLIAASSPPPPPPPPSSPLQLLLLQLFYPCPGCADYDAFTAKFSLGSAAPAPTDAVLGQTIISPASGPGTAANSDYVTEVSRIQAHGGRVLGFIALGNAAKPLADVKSEIDRYYSFYGVDGVYLAETWSSSVSYIEQINGYAKSSSAKPASRAGLVHLAVGFDASSNAFAGAADVLQLFDGTGAAFESFAAPSWTASYDPERFSAFVTQTAASSLDAVLAHAKSNRIGYVYPTDAGFWTLPSYFNQLVDELVASA